MSSGSLYAIRKIPSSWAVGIYDRVYETDTGEEELGIKDRSAEVSLWFEGSKIKKGLLGSIIWLGAGKILSPAGMMGIGCFAAGTIPGLFDKAKCYESLLEGHQFRVFNTGLEAIHNLHR